MEKTQELSLSSYYVDANNLFIFSNKNENLKVI